MEFYRKAVIVKWEANNCFKSFSWIVNVVVVVTNPPDTLNQNKLKTQFEIIIPAELSMLHCIREEIQLLIDVNGHNLWVI